VLLLSLMFLMHLALLPSSEANKPSRKDDPPGRPSDDHRHRPNKFNQRKQPPPSPNAASFLPVVFTFPELPA
jgi:hypothetical protein